MQLAEFFAIVFVAAAAAPLLLLLLLWLLCLATLTLQRPGLKNVNTFTFITPLMFNLAIFNSVFLVKTLCNFSRL